MGERTVVVAVDGSEQADKAFGWYCDNIFKDGDKCVVVFGAEIKISFMPGNVSDQKLQEITKTMEQETARIDQLTAKYAQLMRDKGIRGEAVPVTGKKPGEAIVDKSEELNASMIVMGTRGLGTVRRTFMGSVSDYVVHHAKCPVVVVRDS